MKKPTHLLAVIDRSTSDKALVASKLARRLDARLELFLCDAEHAYALKYAYEPRHSNEVRRSCMSDPDRKLPAALREGQYDVLTMGALTHQSGLARLVGRLTHDWWMRPTAICSGEPRRIALRGRPAAP